MIASQTIDRYLTRYRSVSALLYIAFVMALFLTTVFMLMDIAERYSALNASAEILARLERRIPASSSAPNWSGESMPPGSPFLEGQTVTVASATLLERITSAIGRAGGNVVSSEVETQGAQSKDGFVKVITTCEVDQDRLQQLLYDIEAGMPFLFIEQLVAQAPLPSANGGRLRVLLGVSGLWPGAN
jgi:general secretion pathway protein M